MKYITLSFLGAAMLFSGCGTYTSSGALTGAHLGSVFGSAVGGITGGHYGYHVGTLVGMAGGAAVGAAVGSAADKKANSSIYEYNDAYYNSDYSASVPRTYTPSTYRENGREAGRYNADLQIRNVRFVDANMDNAIVAGEDCKLIFEVMNTSQKVLYDVCPLVQETTGNKHLIISSGVHVERIEPGKGIRYTAMVHADNRLKDGTARFRISAVQGDNLVSSKVSEIDVATRRR